MTEVPAPDPLSRGQRSRRNRTVAGELAKDMVRELSCMRPEQRDVYVVHEARHYSLEPRVLRSELERLRERDERRAKREQRHDAIVAVVKPLFVGSPWEWPSVASLIQAVRAAGIEVGEGEVQSVRNSSVWLAVTADGPRVFAKAGDR